ncbi:MAG: aryl-sulfate sulfotransferase [Myxococcota bacterium]
MVVLLVGWIAGCGVEPVEPEPDVVPPVVPVPAAPVDPPPGPGEPDPDPDPEPIPVGTLVCSATSNALRFACSIELPEEAPLELSWHRSDAEGPMRTTMSESADEHVILVSRLEFDTSYEVWATTPDERYETRFSTPVPPFPSLETSLQVTGTSTMGLIGTELPCSNAAVAVVYDTTTGGLVWYQNLDQNGTLGLLDMVRFTDRGTVLGETGTQIVEVDQRGQDLVRFPTVYGGCCGLHHDVFDWGDRYVSIYQSVVGPVVLDNVVVLDASGAEIYEWRAQQHLTLPPGANGDFLHANSTYVDADGDLYVSWWTPDAIAKFEGSPTTPTWTEPQWVMTGDSQPGTVGNDIVIDWNGITPGRFGDQHNVHIRNDGRLMLLDNRYGRGLVMTVDEQTLTATVDAAYPTRETACGPQGTATDTLAGNAVVACATRWVREYDGATDDLLWEARLSCPNGNGGGWSAGRAARWYPLDHWD